MARFEFRNYDFTLDITGNIFRIPMTTENMQNLMQWGQDVVKKANELSNAENEAVAIKETILFMDQGIDGFLGEGASGRIFSGREPNLFDRIDVMNYITDEFNRFKSSFLKQPKREDEHSG